MKKQRMVVIKTNGFDVGNYITAKTVFGTLISRKKGYLRDPMYEEIIYTVIGDDNKIYEGTSLNTYKYGCKIITMSEYLRLIKGEISYLKFEKKEINRQMNEINKTILKGEKTYKELTPKVRKKVKKISK